MRIRKRPNLQSLCSPFLNSDPPKEPQAAETDPPDPLLLDASPSSPSHTLDSQITSDHKSEWCNKGKKRGRGSVQPAIMEGSRCSRVNGRGWRCCQQTLVGYSLCEHHLGKGRLRSSGGGGGGGGPRGGKKIHNRCNSSNKYNSPEEKEKIGAMKARSISSLMLDETDHAAAAIISSLANSASN